MNLWGDIFRHYAHRCYWNLSIGCSQPRLCVHREKEVIFCTGPKCFFMMIVNTSLKKMDELLRWNVFIVIVIGSGVKLKSRWAGEWGDIFSHASTGQWGFDESTLTFTLLIYYSLNFALVIGIQTNSTAVPLITHTTHTYDTLS